MPAGNIYSTGHLDTRDVIGDFDRGLEAARELDWTSRISVEVRSNRQTEEYAWLGQVPQMRQWVAERHEEVLNKYTHTISNFPYETTLRISVEDLRRDNTGILRTRVGDLARRTVTHWNSLIGTYVANGEAGTSGLGYDGQFFFDTDHNESGSNQTNDLTATEIPSANVATTSTLTTTEAANILTEVTAYALGYTDDKGEPINQDLAQLTVLVTKPGHYAGMVQAIGLNNLGTGSGNNNPVTAWQGRGMNYRVEYVPQRITAADKLYFFIGSPTLSSAAFIKQIEQDVTVQMVGAGSVEEFKTNSHLFGVKAVRGVGYGDWHRAILVTLS
jgi:phage major head subunit gpT-like protein